MKTDRRPVTEQQRAEALAKWAARHGLKLVPRALESVTEFRARLIAALAQKDGPDAA